MMVFDKVSDIANWESPSVSKFADASPGSSPSWTILYRKGFAFVTIPA